jgi:predicted Zn-dependent protease
MTTFQVDPSSLEALASQLASIETQMSNIGDVAAQVSATDLGSSSVYSALQDFHDNWSQGLAKISGNISTVTTHLSAAAQAYGTTETALEQAAGGTAS